MKDTYLLKTQANGNVDETPKGPMKPKQREIEKASKISPQKNKYFFNLFIICVTVMCCY